MAASLPVAVDLLPLQVELPTVAVADPLHTQQGIEVLSVVEETVADAAAAGAVVQVVERAPFVAVGAVAEKGEAVVPVPCQPVCEGDAGNRTLVLLVTLYRLPVGCSRFGTPLVKRLAYRAGYLRVHIDQQQRVTE